MKTNVESLVKMKLRGEMIHPELWVERNYVTTWDGRPKFTDGIVQTSGSAIKRIASPADHHCSAATFLESVSGTLKAIRGSLTPRSRARGTRKMSPGFAPS